MTKRIAVVTGGMGGLGEAISMKLHDAGYAVVVTHSPGNAKTAEWLTEMDRQGYNFRAYGVDVADYDSAQHCVAKIQAEVGPIDILVNNAAITYFMPVADFPEKRFKLMMEVQVYAPFHLSQLVLPSMLKRKQGWIVNISSPAGIDPKPPYQNAGRGGTVYGMCKAALERFTTGLASEVYEDGIAVNVVSPGLVATPGVAVHGLINERMKDRVQPIEYIAEAVFRLASGDPKKLTGRIDYAEPFLKELGIAPSALV